MTKEEIIKGLESVKEECGRHLDESFAWICEPIDGAIKLLEQQPCEDCVSRQAVIEYIKNCGAELGDVIENEFVREDIINMPPVTPTFPKGETNGDVIMAMFPNISVYEHGSTYSVNNEYNFNSTWWNAPYKGVI